MLPSKLEIGSIAAATAGLKRLRGEPCGATSESPHKRRCYNVPLMKPPLPAPPPQGEVPIAPNSDNGASGRPVQAAWSSEEDAHLYHLVITCGSNRWRDVAAALNHKWHNNRTPKHCRERWVLHVDPTIKKGEWTEEEDHLIVAKQREWGNCWADISRCLEGRAVQDVKNRWHQLWRLAQRRDFQSIQFDATDPKEDQHIRLSAVIYMLHHGHSAPKTTTTTTSKTKGTASPQEEGGTPGPLPPLPTPPSMPPLPSPSPEPSPSLSPPTHTHAHATRGGGNGVSSDYLNYLWVISLFEAQLNATLAKDKDGTKDIANAPAAAAAGGGSADGSAGPLEGLTASELIEAQTRFVQDYVGRQLREGGSGGSGGSGSGGSGGGDMPLHPALRALSSFSSAASAGGGGGEACNHLPFPPSLFPSPDPQHPQHPHQQLERRLGVSLSSAEGVKAERGVATAPLALS
ncbi:unnamed protein product [Vitrella brassicaformis CCMP3155]|uniref:Myb-like domain-containing protein n=3 Tax=Vitrella brassicaformis TaxID=1169539 RepID=A0A0G4EQG6_VITBC|nr:unnamed protein product [Vitrella brassicaformis CCMP3155]|eukprot:CEL99472.1 unnamed protein product [Vitrella brassicaformis CCMP3155]